jgi:hypothetical protein
VEVAGVDVAGPVRVWEVNGPEVGAMNSFEQPRRVDVREARAPREAAVSTTSAPAHSITILRLTAR